MRWLGPQKQVRQAFKGRFVSLETQGCLFSSECSNRAIDLEWKTTERNEFDFMCKGGPVPSTKSEFQSLCDLYDEGTFVAQCGRWHKTKKKLVDIQNGGPDLFDGIGEAKMLHCEDKRAFPLRERVLGRHGHVQSTTRFFRRRAN